MTTQENQGEMAVRRVPVEPDVRPTFADWLKEMKISMTVREILDVLECARLRGQTIEQFLGHPWA